MSLKINDFAQISKIITEKDIIQFADVVGDHNPVHLDEEFAKKTRFGRKIAHGMLASSLISAVLGTKLPGPGTIYLSQTLKFTAPVYPGNTISAKVTVTKIKEDKNIITLDTVCVNQNGETVVSGEAVVLVENIGNGSK